MTAVSIDYWASHVQGTSIQCSSYDKQDKPAACSQGTSASVAWTAGSAFVSNAVLGLTLVPLSGWLSDSYGRKPFLLLSAPPPHWREEQRDCLQIASGVVGREHVRPHCLQRSVWHEAMLSASAQAQGCMKDVTHNATRSCIVPEQRQRAL
jgi:hypothetical protein